MTSYPYIECSSEHVNFILMRFIALVFFIALLSSPDANATLPDGSVAPDFSIVDIDGIAHSLYSDYLDNGKSVVLDFSATWCPPCWGFHTSGVMEDLWDEYGPNASDYLVVPLMIEADPNTNQACFYGAAGCNSGTFGDWSGHPYPLCNPPSSEASGLSSDYDLSLIHI